MDKLLIYSLLFVVFVGSHIRNTWVNEIRKDILYKDLSTYLKLPSYLTMLLTFWVWDVDKFLLK